MGTAVIGRPPESVESKFWKRVEIPDDPAACWRWTGHLRWSGHGVLRVIQKGINKNFFAHKLALEIVRGIVPDEGYDIHHTCENGWCVNPDHLEVMTHGAHKRLHLGDYCPQGHEKTPENTYYYKGKPYSCRLCQKGR